MMSASFGSTVVVHRSRWRALASTALLALMLIDIGSARKRPLRLLRPQSRLTGSLHEMRECNASSHVIVMQNWTQAYNSRGYVFINGMTRVDKAMRTVSKGSSTFIRCTEEGTNCEPVLTLRFGSESCGMWKKQRMFWTPMVNSLRSVTHPNRVAWCPVEEDYWEIRNASVDFDSFARICPFPLTNSVWTVRLEAWDQDLAPWLCISVRGKLIRYGSRDEVVHG